MIAIHPHDDRSGNTSTEQLCAKKIVIIIKRKRYCYSNDHNKPDAEIYTQAHDGEISVVNHLTFICNNLLFVFIRFTKS